MNYSYSIVTLVTFFIICTASCTTPPKSDPLRGFTTKYTRDLWTVCFISHRRSNPTIHPNVFIPVCDCILDSTRKDFTRSDLDNKTQGEMIPYFTEATDKCMKELKQTFNIPKMI